MAPCVSTHTPAQRPSSYLQTGQKKHEYFSLKMIRMAHKSILYRLFGFGKLPKKFAGTLETEGIVLIDVGIIGSVTMRNFRAPRSSTRTRFR